MTFANIVRDALSEWRPESGRQQLTLSGPEGSLTVTADRCEEVGCLVWELAFARPAVKGETLESWATRICARVTGLLEPLKTIEIDSERGAAILRSAKPASRGERLLYHELLLKGTGHAELRRYDAATESKRKQIVFGLTHDAIAKFAGDVAAAS